MSRVFFGVLLFGLFGCAVATTPSQHKGSELQPFVEAVTALEFDALSATYTSGQIAAQLGNALRSEPEAVRRAAAVLVAMGAIESADLRSPQLAEEKIASYVKVMAERHPSLLGRIGDADLLLRLSQPPNYDALLAATDVLDVLGKALADGVITGYDLRESAVYDGFPSGYSFIYSHSDLLHLRQLVTLLHRERVEAWVYLTPKVSAFLYREDWGSAGANVVSLADGTRVVQGQELAVMFHFDSPAARTRFQAVVNKYAKRDSKSETGLIHGAWWQPFYYTDEVMADFEAISLVVLTTPEHEATLTVVDSKAQLVIDALQDAPWPVRRERVWVNPAFYRFLNGGYK